MKKPISLFFIGVVIYMLFIPYGNIPKLIIDIQTCPYSTSDYVIHDFDCSNMCSQLHDHLEAKGYNITYYTGFNGILGHSWLETEDGVFIESTQKFISHDIFYNYKIKHKHLNPQRMIEEINIKEEEIKY